MTSEREDDGDAGRAGEDPTHVICMRWFQRFPARTIGPHCSDLSIATMADPEGAEDGTWVVELLEKPAPDVLAVLARADVSGTRRKPWSMLTSLSDTT
jgi:hypothetical protein